MEVKKTKGILTKMMKMALKIGKITILTHQDVTILCAKSILRFPYSSSTNLLFRKGCH